MNDEGLGSGGDFERSAYTFDNETGLRAGIYVGQKIRALRFTAGDSD